MAGWNTAILCDREGCPSRLLLWGQSSTWQATSHVKKSGWRVVKVMGHRDQHVCPECVASRVTA